MQILSHAGEPATCGSGPCAARGSRAPWGSGSCDGSSSFESLRAWGPACACRLRSFFFRICRWPCLSPDLVVDGFGVALPLPAALTLQALAGPLVHTEAAAASSAETAHAAGAPAALGETSLVVTTPSLGHVFLLLRKSYLFSFVTSSQAQHGPRVCHYCKPIFGPMATTSCSRPRETAGPRSARATAGWARTAGAGPGRRSLAELGEPVSRSAAHCARRSWPAGAPPG